MDRPLSLTSLYQTVRPVAVAHRGAWEHCPENSLEAMLEAARLGAEMIEFDLRLTRDGVPVLLHDATVDRTSNGRGAPEDYTLAELKRLNFSYRDGRPTRDECPITAFEEVLAALRDRCCMNIQVYAESDPALRAICGLFRRYELFDRGFLALTGFDAGRRCRAIDPEVEVAILGPGELRGAPAELERCRDFGCRFVQPMHRWSDRTTFDRCRQAGLKANVFYADDAAEMRRLAAAGADGILTNRLELLMRCRASLPADNPAGVTKQNGKA
jgi:glycerophosphoryl diester phosphodiesterase